MWSADRHAQARPGATTPAPVPSPPRGVRTDRTEPAPLRGPADDRIVAVLRATLATGAAQASPLREALRVYVRYLRGRGDPPERVVIAIKERLFEATRHRPPLPPDDASAFQRHVVHWAIDAYYRAD